MSVFKKQVGNGNANNSRPRQPLSTSYRGQSSPPGPSPFVAKPKQSGHSLASRALNTILIIGIIVAVGWSLLIKSPPKIAATSYTYHSASVYRSFAVSRIGGLSDGNKLSFDEQGLVNALQRQFPEISAANVALPIFSQYPTLHLTVAQPTFFISNGSASYILDTEGIIVGKNTDFPQIKNLLLLSDQSGFKLQTGRAALGTSSISFINTLVAQAKNAKVHISSLTLPSGAEEVDLRTTDQPYFVKFYLGGNVLTQTGQWLAARHDFVQNHITPASYLDVRVAGKIFYK